MKNIIGNLQSQLSRLRALIQKREDKVDDMSEKWQESDKCEEWMDKTQEIESIADQLDTLIDEFKEQL